MAWQPTTDLDPLGPGERAFHDPVSGRYAIVLLQEGPTGKGEEKRYFALWWECREVDASGNPVLVDGVPVEEEGTHSVRYARLKRGTRDIDGFVDMVVNKTLEALDGQAQAMELKGRFPLHPKHPRFGEET